MVFPLGVKLWTRLRLEVTAVHTNFAHADVHRHCSFRRCLDVEYLVVEEAVDSKFKAVVLVPIVGIGVHVTRKWMCLAVVDLLCISGHPYAIVPLAMYAFQP
jgi:hypothetical protein